MPESLRFEQFEALLQQLGPDREFAGTRYEQLRRRLISFFEYRHCRDAESLADRTLDRVARLLAKETLIGHAGSPLDCNRRDKPDPAERDVHARQPLRFGVGDSTLPLRPPGVNRPARESYRTPG